MKNEIVTKHEEHIVVIKNALRNIKIARSRMGDYDIIACDRRICSTIRHLSEYLEKHGIDE